jgi:hypothetical protein
VAAAASVGAGTGHAGNVVAGDEFGRGVTDQVASPRLRPSDARWAGPSTRGACQSAGLLTRALPPVSRKRQGCPRAAPVASALPDNGSSARPDRREHQERRKPASDRPEQAGQ